jgi:hypothetical protein
VKRVYMPPCSTPGSVGSPISHSQCKWPSGAASKTLTTLDVLPDSLGNLALVRIVDVLSLLVAAGGAEAALIVHGALQCVTLPSEDVVTVLTEAGRVAGAKKEGLRAIFWPLGLVVELCCIPDDLYTGLVDVPATRFVSKWPLYLEHQLRNLDWMTSRTVTGGKEGRRPALGIRDVVLVVRAVEILSIPAPDKGFSIPS